MKQLLCSTFSLILIVIFCSFLISCESKPRLDKDEAEKIIRNFVKEEKLNYVSGTFGCKTVDVDKLISLGYLEKYNKQVTSSSSRIAYRPTKKAENNILDIDSQDAIYNTWNYVNASVVNKRFKNVDEILIDEKNYIASVKFRIVYEPIEPFYSAICTCDKCEYFSKREEIKTIKLKKYDKGWRPVE